MPPKPPKLGSSSKDLVPVGPRHISTKSAPKSQVKRDPNGERPSTARALVLRNGKHGARGTGELMAVAKLSGREKLDLLAGAISNPMILDPANHPDRGACSKIQESAAQSISN